MVVGGVILLPAVAFAKQAPGPYVNLGVGGFYAGDLRSAEVSTQLNTAIGPVGTAALGWRFGNGLRAELAGSYGSHDISGIRTHRVNGELLPLTNTSGQLGTAAVLVDVLYDLPVHAPAQPYIGAGVGYGWLNLANAGGDGFATFRLANNNVVTGPDTLRFGSAGALAYHFVAGVSLPIPAVRGLSATLEYSFLGTARADVPVTRTLAGNNTVNGVVPTAVSHDGFFAADNALILGLRYIFAGL